MTEQNWDASRRAFRKRINIFLSILIPLVIVSGVIFYNNRDVLFENTLNADTPVKKRDGSIETKSVHKPAVVKSDTVKKTVAVKSDTVKNSVSVKLDNEKKNDTILAGSVSKLDNKLKMRDSVRISGIDIIPEDRKDVIIELTLELFFEDVDLCSEILLRREEIRVISRNILRNRSLNEIKKKLIEPELRDAISLIFDNKNLNDVKILRLQIEKVRTP